MGSQGIPSRCTTDRVLKVEKLGRKVILEDGSEWDIYYFDSGKPNQWIPETTQVVVREGDGHSAYHNTILEEVDYDGTWVNARRIELDM